MIKKGIALLLAVLLLLLSSLCVTAAVVTDGTAFRHLGDANRDDEINIKDLVRMKRVLSGAFPDDPVLAADLDGSGALEAADLSLFARYLLGEELSSLIGPVDWTQGYY